MNRWQPILADGIDLPLVAMWGILVLVPLLAFEVVVEAWILKRWWQRTFGELASLALRANCWSLISGVPVKILNSMLGQVLLTRDLAVWFHYYPWVSALAAFNYVFVTVVVETLYAHRWQRRNNWGLSRKSVTWGMLAANLATNAVLAPLYYLATQPVHNVAEFTSDTRWAGQPATRVIYVDATQQHLRAVNTDGSQPELLVGAAMREFLVSSNLEICVFRGKDNSLYHHRRSTGVTTRLHKAPRRVLMREVAFSPSGNWVAWSDESTVELTNLSSGRVLSLPVLTSSANDAPSLLWTIEEDLLLEASGRRVIAIRLETTPAEPIREVIAGVPPPLLPCYGNVGDGSWGSNKDWGASPRRSDECDDLRVVAYPGLGNALVVRGIADGEVRLAVNPGLLHMAWMWIQQPTLLCSSRECLFEVGDGIYLLDISSRRVGKLATGSAYISRSQQFQKKLAVGGW